MFAYVFRVCINFCVLYIKFVYIYYLLFAYYVFRVCINFCLIQTKCSTQTQLSKTQLTIIQKAPLLLSGLACRRSQLSIRLNTLPCRFSITLGANRVRHPQAFALCEQYNHRLLQTTPGDVAVHEPIKFVYHPCQIPKLTDFLNREEKKLWTTHNGVRRVCSQRCTIRTQSRSNSNAYVPKTLILYNV